MKKVNKYRDQVINLLAGMTLDEKIAQLGAYWLYDLQSKGKLDVKKIDTKLKNGIGQISRIGGAGDYLPVEAAKTANIIQKHLREKTRLGIPAIVHEECCAGLMAPGCSIFPQPIGLASTFEPALAERMTTAIRKQMLAIGSRQGLAPVLDVSRDPRWGRVEETFGEDPTLVSQFGVAYIKGLQSGDLKNGVMATGKHFVGHSFSQGGLNCGPVHIGWHDLWDVYLAPFQAAIRDAGLASMMNAYPELDGEVVAASRRILTELLRDKLGFDGVVVSDYEAVMMIHNYHFLAETVQEAAVRALKAGIDVELPSIAGYGDPLKQALKAGELDVETVDLAVSRHLQKKFELGLFENPYVDEGTVLEEFETSENRTLAYELACKSMVLLKNDGILPLAKSVRKIALIGPNADSTRSHMGDYSFAALAELMMEMPPGDSVFPVFTPESIEQLTVKVPTILESLRAALPAAEIRHAKGCDIISDDESGFAGAVRVAKSVEVVVMVMGGRSGLAPYCTTGEFRDVTDLHLPGVQEKLVTAIIETGKKVILVLVNGRPAAIGGIEGKINAILQAWVPGEEGGKAIAAILTGEVNPDGKLPLSIPRSAGQIPVFYNYKPSGMRSNIYGDYVNEPVTPLYPFGFGLSYTTFDYSNLVVDKTTAKAGEVVSVSLRVKNTGKVAGEEVVQLYIRDDYASLPRPVRELKGFTRVSLDPGETKTITFHLPVDQLAYYDSEFHLQVEAGRIEVMVGSSSDDIRLRGEFEITGAKNVPVEERVFVCPVEIK
jgi:beta-glucosidase